MKSSIQSYAQTALGIRRVNRMKLVIRITGKSRDVFACIRKMAEDNPQLTLGEIVDEHND